MERLVESLKVQSAPHLHAQVFFCMRIMLARVSADHLHSLWPLVLMELIRVFQNHSVAPVLLLAACKFVDLALVLLPRYAVYFVG